MLPHSAFESYINNKYDSLNSISNYQALINVKRILDNALITKENSFINENSCTEIDLDTLYACKKALELNEFYKWHILEFNSADLPEESFGCNAVEIIVKEDDLCCTRYVYKHALIKDYHELNENIIAWRYTDYFPTTF